MIFLKFYLSWRCIACHSRVTSLTHKSCEKMGLTHAFFSFVHIMSQKGAAEPSEMGTSIINVQMPRALHHEIHVDDLNQVWHCEKTWENYSYLKGLKEKGRTSDIVP